jgi:hypothetical protein
MPTRENNTSQDGGKLLSLARSIDDAMARCRNAIEHGQSTDGALADQLVRRRAELASATPETALDALVMIASAETVAQVLLTVDLEELGEDGIHVAVAELTLTLDRVREFLEQQAGVTAQTLGINPQGTAWQ